MALSILSSALIATLVGFAGTVALIVAAAQAVGATPAQTASWITSIALATAASAAYLSLRYRMPIITAWSTPGAALIGAASGIAFDAAVGAFVLAALLIVATAMLRPLGRLVERIPTPVAAAMLAGVLLPFVLAAFQAVPQAPALTLAMIAAYLLLRPASPLFAVVIALAAGVTLAWGLGLIGTVPAAFVAPTLQFVVPRFEATALLGLGLPLYLVTMASQNLPGLAVLRASGYQPPVAPVLAATGTLSAASALFGAHTTNLAAITAAICTGPEAHRDPAERWRAGLAYAAMWLGVAAVGAAAVAWLGAAPPALIAVIVGLALLAPLLGALSAAMKEESHRFAALIAFAVTAAGVDGFGVGAPFWGLAAGLGVHALERYWTRLRRRADR